MKNILLYIVWFLLPKSLDVIFFLPVQPRKTAPPRLCLQVRRWVRSRHFRKKNMELSNRCFSWFCFSGDFIFWALLRYLLGYMVFIFSRLLKQIQVLLLLKLPVVRMYMDIPRCVHRHPAKSLRRKEAVSISCQ